MIIFASGHDDVLAEVAWKCSTAFHTIVLDRMPVASMLRDFLLSWYWWVVLQGYMFLEESSCYNSLLLRGYVLLLAASLLLRAFVLVGAMWSRPNLP